MINEREWMQLKSKVKKLEKKQSEAIGAIRQITKQLNKEFGFKSVKEAKKGLKKLKKEQAKHEEKFNREFVKFAKQFGKLLQAIEDDDPEVHRIAKACLKKSGSGKKGHKKGKKGNKQSH